MHNPVQDKDLWSANANTYAKSTTHLSNAPIEMLLTQMNSALPFTSATVTLDVGSGPGVTVGRLIESYGMDLPRGSRM